MKIGVFGPNGNLGNELCEQGCEGLGCDINDKQQVYELLGYGGIDVVINCAAYTKVDDAETKDGYEKAIIVNTRGVETIRQVVSDLEIPFIHISTDYVFSGNNGPYTEKAITFKPVNAYGFSKYGGEIMFLNPFRDGDTLVRTTGLYGGHRHDFYKLVVSTLRDTDEFLWVTNELYGNQTYIPHLAEALIHLANMKDRPLVLNLGSKEVITRYEFAKRIAEKADLDVDSLLGCKNEEILCWVAKRPTAGGLDVSLAEKLGIPIYTIDEGLEAMTNEI